jgi:hypothetical protein
MFMAASLVAITLNSSPAFGQFAGPQPLQLENGWFGAPTATSLPSVEEVDGIVQFRGAVAGGVSPTVFQLPPSLTPSTTVFIPVDLCNSTNGRLQIEINGTVIVQAENSNFSNAQCLTSLDGASFALNATGFTPLTLINGWTTAPFNNSSPAVSKINGLVHFKGAISTNGSNPDPFVLPVGFRPATDVFVNVDLCSATKGELHITSSGVVSVEAENGTFSNAQCFTSLDGASFTPVNTPAFQALTLTNGWTNAPSSTAIARVTNAYGIVSFKGAIANGTSPIAFVLPPAFSPVTDVFIPLDLCNAHKGRLHITTSGFADIETENNDFANAQCLTSLEGASFVQ